MKLRTKLLLAIVPVVAGALFALGWGVYARLGAHATEELEQRMALMLDQTERQVRTDVATLEANARLFASSELIERYVLVEDEGERFDLMQPALLELFSEYRAAYPDYREIRLVLPDGYEDTRIAAPGLVNRTDDESGAGWFGRLPRDGTSTHLEFGRSDDDGTPRMLVAQAIRTPARDAVSGDAPTALRGWLVVGAAMSGTRGAIERGRIGEAGRLALADGRGRTVFATPDGGRTRGVAEAHGVVPGIDDATRIVRSRDLPGGLALHAVVPARELAAARLRIALAIGGLVLVAIALTSALLFLSMRRLVLDPIAALGAAARTIGDGHGARLVDAGGSAGGRSPERLRIAATRLTDRRDEIGELAAALRGMQVRLERSIAELRGSHDRIEQLAFRDALTGLPNRRSFITLVERALADAAPAGRAGAASEPVRTAVLFLDLDDFKRVNDTVGHEAGDELLRCVARRLEGCVRGDGERADSRSPVARLGGDEFTVLLPGLAGPHGLRRPVEIARRIIGSLTAPIELSGREFVVGTSIGIALAPDDATDAAALIKCADIAMYEAKRHGPNAWRQYGHDMQHGIDRRLELEQDLREAIARDQLSLDFQPQYALAGPSMIGVEALLRWRHPTKGAISPVEFVPIAEDTGLIGPIGEWVLDEACRRWRAWEDAGIAPARVAVNVSQRQLALCPLAELVPRALTRHRLPPGTLEIELTESCMMEAQADVVAVLAELRGHGVRVAMDDFGTGYSSLAALTSLPLDTLKIDRSFVTGITSDTPNEKVVSAILTLAHELGLEIVAEGVETDAELEFLRERACDVVQGYLLGRPLSIEATTELLERTRAERWRRAG